MPALLIGGAALLGAGGSIFSGIMGASGAKKAAEANLQATRLGINYARESRDLARGDLAPFREAGVKATGQLSDILSGNKTADQYFKESAQFRFESDIGQRNINRQLSARGGYNSGAGLEALSLFNAALVGAEGQNQFKRIFDVAQLGGNASAQSANNTTQAGNTMGQIALQGGQAQAANIAQQYNAYGSIGTGVAGAAQGAINSGVQYSLYKPYFDRFGNGSDSFPSQPRLAPSYVPGREAQDYSTSTFNNYQ